MLRVLTLSSLFPDASRPNFGVFVERQTLGIAAHPDVELKVVAPIGIPPRPFDRLPHYAPLRAVPARESWRGVDVRRPRFTILPGTGGRFHAASLVRRLTPLLAEIRAGFPFDVIDAQFFFPDGPAAIALGRMFGVPVSIKARGADVHHWGTSAATARQVLRAGRQAGRHARRVAGDASRHDCARHARRCDSRPSYRGRSRALRARRPRNRQGTVRRGRAARRLARRADPAQGA